MGLFMDNRLCLTMSTYINVAFPFLKISSSIQSKDKTLIHCSIYAEKYEILFMEHESKITWNEQNKENKYNFCFLNSL